MNSPFLCAPSLCAPPLCTLALTQSTPILMQMVIEQAHLTMLRQAIRHSCRMEIEILLLKPCLAGRLKIGFLVSQHLIDTVMDTIMQTLPAAQFGRYHEVSDHVPAHVLTKLEQDLAQEYSQAHTPSDPPTMQHAHTCPVCQRLHQVNAAMHALSYGKPYTCSLACELKRRQHWWHFSPDPAWNKR